MIAAVAETLNVVERAKDFGIDIPMSYQARMARVIAARNGELPEDDPDYDRLTSLAAEINITKHGLKDKSAVRVG